jgi:hypothetical protein
MRRLKRSLFRLLALLSLLLLVGVGAVWVRSSLSPRDFGNTCEEFQFRRYAEVETNQSDTSLETAFANSLREAMHWDRVFKVQMWSIGIENKKLFWGSSTDFLPDNQPGWHFANVISPHGQAGMLDELGFTAPRLTDESRFGVEILQTNMGPKESRFIFVPLWYLLIVGSILPLFYGVSFFAMAARRGIARNRIEKNSCSKCGYDLRATPDRCPECGAIFGA